MSRWLAAVTTEWSLILLSFAALDEWSWCAPLIVFLVATRQHALAILGHEAAHQNGRLNDWLARLLCWWPMGIDLAAYRRFHFKHHKNLGSVQDPEEVHRLQLSPWQWRLPITRKKVAVLFVLDLMGLGMIETLTAIRVIGKPSGIGWVAPAVAVASALLFLFCWPLGLLWHYSLLCGPFWTVSRWRMLTEHVGAGKYLTHATVEPSLWKRCIFLPHWTWKHAEHHLTPRKRQCKL